jgi:hypothetical protein
MMLIQERRFLGRPRGRMAESKPSRRAVRINQASSPKGPPPYAVILHNDSRVAARRVSSPRCCHDRSSVE